MTNPNAIEVKAKWGANETKSIPCARLEYYMENNPRQKEWRLVPGYIVGADKDDAMRKAEAIAAELSDLDLYELAPATRTLYEQKRMFRTLEDVS